MRYRKPEDKEEHEFYPTPTEAGDTSLSELLGMAKPYDWSNRNMPSKAFIVSVLSGGHLKDIAKCVRHFGSRQVTARLNDVADPLLHRVAERKVRNTVIAIDRADAEFEAHYLDGDETFESLKTLHLKIK